MCEHVTTNIRVNMLFSVRKQLDRGKNLCEEIWFGTHVNYFNTILVCTEYVRDIRFAGKIPMYQTLDVCHSLTKHTAIMLKIDYIHTARICLLAAINSLCTSVLIYTHTHTRRTNAITRFNPPHVFHWNDQPATTNSSPNISSLPPSARLTVALLTRYHIVQSSSMTLSLHNLNRHSPSLLSPHAFFFSLL